jgi:uncharacterized protein (TIGR02147 family)
MSIYEYLDYVDWVTGLFQAAGKAHGLKKRMADAIGCQQSYLSLVLKKEAHFTLEHAERLARFWQLPPDETDYLLLLVNFARAGSEELRSYYREKLARLKEQNEHIGHRIKNAEAFPEHEAAVYYSSWQYLAIHILISIPEFHSSKAIAERLQLPEKSVIRVLQYLERLGLAEFARERWRSTSRELHLPRESHFVSLHHGHWRNRAVDNSFLARPEDVHYTGVSSIAKKDIEKLRQLLFKLIDDSRGIIAPSAEEELICLNIDLYKV